MPIRRRFRLLLVAAQHGLRGVGRHWLSLLSLAVLSIAAVVGLTLEGADDRPIPQVAAASTPALTAIPGAPLPTPTVHVPAPRPLLTLFLVESEVQRDGIAAAIQADSKAREAGPGINEYVVYLLAGTREEEMEAIQRINFETTNAMQHRVDLRVIDLRTSRP